MLSKLWLMLAVGVLLALAGTAAFASNTYTVAGTNIIENGNTKWVGGGADIFDQYGLTNSSGNGIKAVREVVDFFSNCPLGTSGATIDGYNLQGLQAVVNNNRSQGYVTILCVFGWDSTTTQVDGTYPESYSWFYNNGNMSSSLYAQRLAALASQFAGQSDVWIDPWNEPYDDNVSAAEWETDMSVMYHAVRGAGNNNIMLLPCPNWDSDETYYENNMGFVKSMTNIVGTVHIYSGWDWDTEANIQARIQTLLNDGCPLLVGEIGPDSYQSDPIRGIEATIAEHVPTLAWCWNSNDGDQLQNGGTFTSWGSEWFGYIGDYVPIGYVQQNYSCQSSATSVAAAMSSSETEGDMNVVAIGWGNTTSTVSSVTDSQGNTYRRSAGPTTNSGIGSQSLYYAPNIKGGSDTVTVTFNTSTPYPDLRVLEYAGANDLDQYASGNGNSSTSSTGSVTTTDADELLFAANYVATWTTGAGSGFTSRVITSPDGDIAEDEVVGSTGNYSSSAPLGQSGAWVMDMSTYMFASPPAPPANLAATGGSGKVSLTWSTASGATSYKVYRGTSSLGENLTPIKTGLTSASYTDTSVTNGTTYYYEVTAVSGNGESGRSNEASAKPSAPTIAFKQENYSVPNSATSVTVTFGSSQIAGDLNVVAVGWNDTTTSVSSVTDSAGNTYHLAVGPAQGSAVSQSIYYASNIKSGSNTVTVTFSGSTTAPDIRALEYSGVSTLDKTATGSGNSSTSSTSSATTTSADELIFGANLVYTGTTGPGSGFTSRVITSPDGDIAEDEIVSSTGSYSASAPLAGSGPWAMAMATFH